MTLALALVCRAWRPPAARLVPAELPCTPALCLHSQTGSGGATQYGQQRGGGVSKEVMERVQVGRGSHRLPLPLLFARMHASLLWLLRPIMP